MSVDPGAGSPLERTLDREYYLSDEIFAREQERILFREWFCVGREEELPEVGNFAVKDVAGESMLLVRTSEGRLAGHYNVCRHRGSQLVPDKLTGTFAGGIRCPYHSWTYTLAGTSSRAPFAGLDDDEQVRHKGELIYPNFLLSLSAEHVAAFTLWPQGPDRTTIANEFLFHPGEMAKPGYRSVRRGGVLGPGEPAGLGDLRVGPARDAVPGVPVGLLRADGEREPGHPAPEPHHDMSWDT